MRTLHLEIQLTLDGFGTGLNNDNSWFTARSPNLAQLAYAEELHRKADVLLMGRVLYQDFETMWPALEADPATRPELRSLASVMNAKPKIVFSRTLERLAWRNCLLVHEIDPDKIRALKEQPGGDIVLDGGMATAREFMRLGLIDEYHLIFHPVFLGQGKSLFSGQDQLRELELLETRPLSGGLVLAHYRTTAVKALAA